MLHDSLNTQRGYERHAKQFLAFVDKPISAIRVGDVQAFVQSLFGQAQASRVAAVSAVKSMLSFAQELGYVPMNAGKAMKASSVKNTLGERIMPEADALLVTCMESNARNRALLALAYGGGLRVSEVCGLR